MKRSMRIFGISSRGLAAPGDFETLANIFADSASGFVPSKMGLYEPIRQKFDPAAVRSLAERGEDHFQIQWKSAKSDIEATKYIPGYMHGTLMVAADSDVAADPEIERLIVRISEAFQPTLMMVHLLNERDRGIDSRSGMRIDASDRPTFSAHWTDLNEGLPNFYWGMVFGKPYLELFGSEKLLATPADRVVRVAAETIFIQLTPSILDCESRHDVVVEARKMAIRHLGETAFMASTIEATGLAVEKGRTSIFGKRSPQVRMVPALAP
jgi:hypothetical protein